MEFLIIILGILVGAYFIWRMMFKTDADAYDVEYTYEEDSYEYEEDDTAEEVTLTSDFEEKEELSTEVVDTTTTEEFVRDANGEIVRDAVTGEPIKVPTA